MRQNWSDNDKMETGNIRDTIHVYVEYSTDDEEYGPVYVASCVELGVVSYGRTLDELLSNLREAIVLHLEGMDTVAEYSLAPNPRIMVMLMVNL
jgi:predicted RNase H-like HicB family nuclease